MLLTFVGLVVISDFMTLGGVGGGGGRLIEEILCLKKHVRLRLLSFIVSSVTVCHKMKPLKYRE